jgi:hypothetical protein
MINVRYNKEGKKIFELYDSMSGRILCECLSTLYSYEIITGMGESYSTNDLDDAKWNAWALAEKSFVKHLTM